ncbi:flagellar assembly protein FliW [Clostridium botulinum]|uniref:Flagellar assembly factor FliW n=1 Tax=Clostridium botulinum D str. 1873 TaxID=592027 RepID=A0A9P2LLA5_CLOBO|nr:MULTISPECIES: flagellar assembly protein FliW [Clostridium]AYF55040.1 flagellar assembly protein FliW [Clostridium novyi]EES91270.1 flagellar assembly factor FliW [Clostridium botulinum D str. 1873]MCD3216627.1 flagellar assembly protein FliW [Clostridium botulinum C]MCD3244475.1 flagellar assembly protein FliW [Clostridium botulinum C]MCD3261034.1 flagellar assembly protein FliW [Clostridium botulinum C]
MKLETKCHGIIEYNKDDIIEFKKGIPGFDNLKKFINFPIENNEVFSVLHSIENNEIGFIVTSPFSVINDYEINLDDNVINRLKIEKEKDVLVLNTVTLHSKLENITVNLCAPIVINIKTKLGEQIILNNGKYEIKHPLFKEDI